MHRKLEISEIFTAFSVYKLGRLKMYTVAAVRPTQTAGRGVGMERRRANRSSSSKVDCKFVHVPNELSRSK
jgi:hypothetical protein